MLARRLFLMLPHRYATRQLFATPVSSTLPPSSQSQETQEKHRFSNHLHAVVAHPKTTQKDVPSPASPHHMVDELTGTTIRLLGPLDFANYLRRQYPHLIGDEITVLLKEINAHCFSHLATARGHIQLDMMKFSDKMIAAKCRTCTCAARGFAECPPRGATATNDDDNTTPVRTAIAGHRLHLSPCEGNFFEQADRTVHTAHQTNVPQMDTVLQHILYTVTLFAK